MSSGFPSGPSLSSSASAPPPSATTAATATLLSHHPPPPTPTFHSHLILPFSVSLTAYGQGRAEAGGEIREAWKRLIGGLEGKGLRVTARTPRGGGAGGAGVGGTEEIWVFISAPSELLHSLYQQELSQEARFTGRLPRDRALSEADEIRLVWELLVGVPEQGGLGITPGEGEWKRVKSVVAVHDDVANHKWIQSWISKKWYIGLHFSSIDQEKLRSHFGESLTTYFTFLSTYTLSLIPLSIFGILYHFLPPYSPIYALGVSIWGIAFVEVWKRREIRLRKEWGVEGGDGERLRVDFVDGIRKRYGEDASLSKRTLEGSEIQENIKSTRTIRESKLLLSLPLFLISAFILFIIITTTFILEAFITHLYTGPGASILSIAPTLIFVGVVPFIVAGYHKLSVGMTRWEGWPTRRDWEGSLTVKTFALNAVTAYLGLFLSAYIYVPFGELIMSYLSLVLSHHPIQTNSAEGAGLGPSMSIQKRVEVKSDRLVNQMFAYTVTNQAVNAFTELGLPYVMRYVNTFREGSSLPIIGLATKGKKKNGVGKGVEMRELDKVVSQGENRFLQKVGRELCLPEYNIFIDYAEMVTQFGYITLWSIIWPLAPLFAFVNNYIELRSDAVKICSHVRRPIPCREATIGVWAEMLTFLTWLAALTNATLVYLFKPILEDSVNDQSINPSTSTDSFTTFGTNLLHSAMRNSTSIDMRFSGSKRQIIKTALPSLIPVLFVALLASHGYLVIRWIIRRIVERVMDVSAAEEKGSQRGAGGGKEGKIDTAQQEMTAEDEAFWRGTAEGMEEIRRVLKVD